MKYKILLLSNGAEVTTIKKIAKRKKEEFGSYTKELNYYSEISLETLKF